MGGELTKERWHCLNCEDYSQDREQHLLDDGSESTPTCKHCGAECADEGNDSRYEEVQQLTYQLDDLQEELDTLSLRRDSLLKQIQEDYWQGTREKE